MAKDTCKDKAYIEMKKAYEEKQRMERFRKACGKKRDEMRGKARTEVSDAKKGFVNEVANTPVEDEFEA